METDTEGRVLTAAKIENLKDLLGQGARPSRFGPSPRG